ncbi:MAG: hypothetical protein ACXAC7_06545 [Candidatus Hodarchaeales archaeon]|jgi:hypothetical protein
MLSTELSIRNYENGDETAQAKIFNTVIVEMDPETPLIESSKVKKRHEAPEFKPEQVKYLLNSDKEIVGYVECRIFNRLHNLFFPLILKDYRSEETLNMLFREIYDFAKNNDPTAIEAHYSHNLDQAHDFFKNQPIVKVTETREVNSYSIPIEKLGVIKIPDYELKPFTPNEIETLIEFQKNEKVLGGNDTVDALKENFKNGNYSQEQSFLVYRKDKLLAFHSVRIYPGPEDENPRNIDPYGSLNGYSIDSEHEDGVNLRKAMISSCYKHLKKNNIGKFQVPCGKTSAALPVLKDMGFELTGEGQFHYVFETN